VRQAGVQARYQCADCGRDLTGVGFAVACLCGATYRRRVEADPAVFRRPADADAVPADRFKDWTVKYLQFTWNVTQLRRLYSPGAAADAAELRTIAEHVFSSCSELADWLSTGPEPACITPAEVARLVAAEPLCIALAVARSGPASRTTSVPVPVVKPFDASRSMSMPRAALIPVRFAGQPRLWVQYELPGAKAARYDAHDLAERCLRSWLAFFHDRPVVLPTWPA
jgi:hypothetical protein